MPELIQTADFETSLGTVHIASSDRGLVYLGFPLANGRGFWGWQQRFAPGCRTCPNEAVHRELAEQVRAFIGGERKTFDVPVDLRVTPFQETVLKVVSEIGWGETLSYKEVATRVGDERAVRAVGSAVGANPLALVIPCHRVVGMDGKLHGYAGGLHVKARLLAAEQSGPGHGRLF